MGQECPPRPTVPEALYLPHTLEQPATKTKSHFVCRVVLMKSKRTLMVTKLNLSAVPMTFVRFTWPPRRAMLTPVNHKKWCLLTIPMVPTNQHQNLCRCLVVTLPITQKL